MIKGFLQGVWRIQMVLHLVTTVLKESGGFMFVWGSWSGSGVRNMVQIQFTEQWKKNSEK